ncbi:MAG: hypothetical protein KIT69_13095 [Propionibacteriaceae bacterium]|nr:hypothetical protein [Propionibacteriaceae bacterium]
MPTLRDTSDDSQAHHYSALPGHATRPAPRHAPLSVEWTTPSVVGRLAQQRRLTRPEQ